MDDLFDDEFEEFMAYELTHDEEEDADEELAVCEICGKEFVLDIQYSDRVLCPECELFDY